VESNKEGIAKCKKEIQLKSELIKQIKEDEKKLENLRLEKFSLQEMLDCMKQVSTLEEHDSQKEVKEKLKEVESDVKAKLKHSAQCVKRIKKMQKQIDTFVKEGATQEANAVLSGVIVKLEKNIAKRERVEVKFLKLRDAMMREIEKSSSSVKSEDEDDEH
jgi:hypothetical protein